MANVVAIINDDRVRRQAEQYLQQLGKDDLRFATFNNQQEFAAQYLREAPEEAPTPKPDAAALEDLKLFSEVHLLIFALDSIGEKSGPWIDKLLANFAKFKHLPKEGKIRLMMLKYEDDGISKLDVLHPALDDLIYLPLDRLVFMQKMEILLGPPRRVKPSYLFNQEVRQNIEISKITKLDRLSDVGLAIRNPLPLKKGLPGHFYVTLPGEKNRIEVQGKVFRNEPHPEIPGQHLVYFNYFGLKRSDLSTIRRTLARAPRYKSLYNDDPNVFRFKPDSLFMQAEDSKKFGVAVIDPDQDLAASLAQQIGKDMDRLDVIGESSFSYFTHKYLDTKGAQEHHSQLPKATEAADFYKQPLTLNISVNDLKCLSLDPGPEPGEKLLGHAAVDLFAAPDRWLTLFKEKGSRLILEEALKFASTGLSVERLLIAEDAEGQRRAVKLKVSKGAAEHLAVATLSPASMTDIASKADLHETKAEIELLILNTDFLPENPGGWIEGLRHRAAQVGLVKSPEQLKFILITNSEAAPKPGWVNCPDLLGLFVKPVDIRGLMFTISEALGNKNSVYQFENLGWSQPATSLHVSKEVDLLALSEFGATIKSKQPMTVGTIMYLRKSIYENAPNQCLAARVYFCEENTNERGTYLIYATYFGINDHFLKFARTWIRENYAAQKTKEA